MPELVFPSDQIVDWTANTHTGVIGGIPTDYTQSGSTITATGSDQRSQINTAISNASAGQFVLLGEGTFLSAGSIIGKSGVILRGTSQTGTILSITSGNTGFSLGANAVDTADTVTAGNSRGSDTITIASTAAYAAGDIIRITATDTLAAVLPIISTTGQINLRAQTCRVVSKTATTLTFFPSLHADWSAASLTVARFVLKYSMGGLEKLTIDGATSGAVIWGVQFSQCIDCWIKEVTVKNCSNYNVHLWDCLNTEISQCVIGPLAHGGSNGAGLLHEGSCQSLIIDNIIFDSFPNLELWGAGNMGNAIAYNMMDITTGAGLSDHNASNGYNVIEGNVVSSMQEDGYFGTCYRQTAFRNWFFGIRQGIESGEPVGFAISINRMNRYVGFVGNYFAAEPSYGNPALGNSNSSGIAAPSCSSATLTTRTSATAGTITGQSGHTVTTGATITIAWAESGGGSIQLAKIRRGVTVGTVSGTSIPFSGGLGDDLPAQSSTVYIPNTNGSLAAWWAQVNGSGSTITGSLTTRTDDTTGVFTVSGSGTIISDNWPTSFRWASGFRFQLTTGTVVGGTVPLSGPTNPGGDVLPAVSTVGALWPGPNGFQELDLDTIVSAWSIGNWWASEGGIPSWETLGGDTLQDSLIFTSAPPWMSGYTFPFNPNSGTPDAADIPAGDRYLNGIDPEGPIVNVTTLNVTNLVIG